MNSDLEILILRAWAASPHPTFNDLSIDLRTLGRIPLPHIQSSFSVIPPRLSSSVCRLHAPSMTFSFSSRATLPPHPVISKRHCSGTSSTSSRSRLCSVAPPRVLTRTYVAWAWRVFTRSYRRRVTPYLSDGTLSPRCGRRDAGA